MYQDFAKIYHDHIADDVDHELIYKALVGFLQEVDLEPKTVLDLGAGSGLLARYFLKDGAAVTLVDASIHMLNLAQESLPRVYRPEFIHLMAQDFKRSNYYDFAYSTLDLPNYLAKEDFSLVLGNVYDSLKKGGLYVFDVTLAEELKAQAFEPPFILSEPDRFMVWSNELYGDELFMELETFQEEETGCYRRHFEEQTMYLHDTQEVTRMCQEAGFFVRQMRNGYTKDKTKWNLRHNVWVLRKE